MTLSAAQARRLVKRVLGEATFDDVRVSISSARTGNTRFARSSPTTSGDVETLEVSVTAAKNGRHATASGNRIDDASLSRLVKQAETLASLAPVDPEFMPPLGKTKIPKVDQTDRAVAKMGGEERMDVVRSAIEAANKQGTEIAGYLEHEQAARVVADRAGLFGFHDRTQLSLSCTCRTPDGTGSAKRGFVSHAAAGLEAGTMAAEAANWALRSKGPTGVEPGRYTVVLTAEAVADLMSFFVWALDHRDAVEGRSYFSQPGGKTKLGMKLFGDGIRLWSDPADPQHPAAPMSGSGLPQPNVTWVEGGTLKALSASRWWAAQRNMEPVPTPSSFHMDGGTQDLDGLIAGVDEGILVSRFWYNRMLAPESILATGLTRDGTFWIEKGKIVRPIKNFRYNDSPVTLLKNAVALGKPERASTSTRQVMVMPPMVVEGFNFESTSDAV